MEHVPEHKAANTMIDTRKIYYNYATLSGIELRGHI